MSIILSFMMLLSITVGIDFSAYALSSNGSCGTNVTYTFDSSTGTLTISGTGAMNSYYPKSSNSSNAVKSPFNSKTEIREVIVKDGVTSIGQFAFEFCTGLTCVILAESVTSIGDDAFSHCSSLTSITIPDSVTSIGSYAFSGCSGLSIITIPDSVTSIRIYAFSGCSGLTSVTIPDSVTKIGADAFYGCTGLTSVTIPDSVTSIGGYAFSGCTSLSNVTIPDSVTSIGSYAFSGCGAIVYSGTASGSPWGAKVKCKRFENGFAYTDNEKTQLAKYLGNDSEVDIPDSVTSIGSSAFRDCTSVSIITIPDSVTSIGSYAFYGCSGLINVTIGNSVTSIGNYAFIDCTSLTSVTIPDSVTSIGDNAFYGCGTIIYPGVASGSPWGAGVRYNIIDNGFAYYDNEKTQLAKYLGNDSEVVIPDSVTSIGNNAFSGCSVLTSVSIPDSVTSIGSDAFSGCGTIIYSGTASGSPWGADVRYNIIDNGFAYYDNEKTQLAKYLGNDSVVVIPDGVTSISASAFRGYTGLTSITIPDSVTNIGNYAFYGCTGLTSITIPDSVTSIGDFAFSVCTGLTSITIPDSVTNIDGYAFYGCTELKELTMPCSANYSYAFGGCSNIEKVTLTKGTGIMKDYDSSSYMNTPWYSSRNNLKEIVLEDEITKIGNYVFYDCTGLERITIPSSVTSIGNNAFNTLTEVTIPASMKIDFSGFDGCTNLQKINLNPGSGTMADWSLDYQDSLWYKHKETIKEVKLEEGIKNISESAFYECTNLAKTNVPSTVDSIGRYAYYGCDNLRNLTISSMQCKIPDNPNTISSFATIYAPSGSTAEQYAVKYNRDFESTGEYICVTHTPVTDKAVAPTGTSTGLTEGSHCSVCGEVLVAQQVVPALIPEGASVAINGDKAVITLSDGSTITVPKDTKETVKNADGTYTVTLNDGKSVTVSSNTEITKTADGQLNVKATDNGKTTTVTVPSGSSVVKDGDSYKVIIVNGTETVEKTVAAGETVVIDKSGSMSCNGNHKWDKGVVTIAATCTSEGVKTYTCSVCGNQKIEKLKKVAHKPVADKAVPATFISAGKTAGTHCSVCGKTIVAQKPVAMLGAAKLSKVKKGKKSFTATWKPVANVDGYEIQYSLKKNMKKAKTKSVASSKKKLKVKKLKAKKKYYVRIRDYKVINGKKQYSAWSAKKKVKTK